MSVNIEIKAKYSDLNKAKSILETMDVRFEGIDFQCDTFFPVPNGRLKLRESKLYGNLLIPYLRADKTGPKKSEYALLDVDDPNQLKSLLGQILGAAKTVSKTRAIFHYKNVRIHLDEVDNLNSYIELEAVLSENSNNDQEHQKIDFLMEKLQISSKDLISVAYFDLLYL